MKNRVLIGALLLFMAVVMIVGGAEAQNKRIGTSAAPELLIPVGARDLAMGGATIANTFGVEAIHFNPAGLGLMKYSAEGLFSSMSYIADLKVSYGAIGANFGDFGTLGISVRSIDFGDIPLTTNEDPYGLSGRLFSPTYVTIGATYARSLTDAIAIGLTGKLISEQIDRVSATGFGLDVGIMYRGLGGVSGLNLGVAVKNIGPGMKFEGAGLLRPAKASDGLRPNQLYTSEAAKFELPSLVEIGLAYVGSMDEFQYSVNGSFTNNNLYLDEWKMGGELAYATDEVTLAGRAGYNLIMKADADDKIFGATLGFGVTYKTGGVDVTLDYAFRQVDLFNNNNVFSLKLGF